MGWVDAIANVVSNIGNYIGQGVTGAFPSAGGAAPTGFPAPNPAYAPGAQPPGGFPLPNPAYAPGGSMFPSPGVNMTPANAPSLTPEQIMSQASTSPGAPGAAGTPAGAAAPAAGGAADPNMLAKVIHWAVSNPQELATAWQAYQQYSNARTMGDPSALISGAKQLQVPLGKNLKASIARTTGAQMQEAGLSGAPGLYKQALAQAIAPYKLQQQQQSLQDYMNSLVQSNQMYPLGGPEAEFSNFLNQLALRQAQTP